MIQGTYDDSAIDAKVIFAFQGGKPMLAELSYYKQFCAKLNVLKSYTEGELYDLDKRYFTLWRMSMVFILQCRGGCKS